MAEKTITIRIDEELHKKIKVAIAKDGVTLKEYILKLIQIDLESKGK